MAIQQRRGNAEDFDSSKMLPGEIAVAVDTKKAYVTIAAGDVKEIGFKGDVEALIKDASEATIADGDTVPFTDVDAADVTKKITWASMKATLKSYFDALYTTALNLLTGYIKPESKTAIAETDTINEAIGKLEAGVDTNAEEIGKIQMTVGSDEPDNGLWIKVIT